MLLHIIDDDAAAARTVARTAKSGGWEPLIHDSADGFLTKIAELPYGCIVSDINMPRMTGTELIQVLHERCPEWPVVMMTGYAEVDAAISSFRNGAVHFLRKPFKRADLLTALAEAAQVGERRRKATQRQQQAAAIDKLTTREVEILSALAKGQQSKTIAWELGISPRTVEMHRSNVLAKLDVANTTQAVSLLQMAVAT